MFTVAIIGCAFVLVLLIIFNNVKNKRRNELLRQFPSYPAYPIIGNVYLLWGPTKDLYMKVEKLIQGYDRLLSWFGSFPVLVFTKHDDIATILTHSQEREHFNLVHEWAGDGIIVAEYEEWKKSRRILGPAFNSEMLAKYTNIFNKRSLALVNSFKSVANTGETVNVIRQVAKANIDTIAENTIGVSIKTAGESGEKFNFAVSEGIKCMLTRVMIPWLYPPFMYRLYLKFSGKDKFIEDLNRFPSQILKNELRTYQNANHEFSNDDDSCNTVLNLLLKGGLKESSFTESRMANELKHIIFGAIESTTLTISFLMLMMAIHQDIQQRAYEEIVDLLRDTDDTLTPNHLSNELKYLEQCIYETIRLYSPTVLTTRRIHKDCVLKDNTIVPANTTALCLIHWAQRDKELYKNPSNWDPEHFSESEVQNRPRSAQLNFGYGPRYCIGNRYAIMSIKTQITHILRHYHLSTNIKQLTTNDLILSLGIRSGIRYPITFTTR